MTEKEKMLNGKLYNSFDPQLLKERQYAKDLLFDYNALRPNEIEKRNDMLRTLLGKTGKTFFIEPPFRCDYGYNIRLGENFYANYNWIVLDCAPVTIGDNVLIAPGVGFYTAGHPIDCDVRNSGLEYAFPITIGNNVWIGGNVVVNPGVTIGDNTIIGAGSIVTKDIPSNVVAVGNPCRVLRQITDEDKQYYFKKLRIESQ